MLGRWLLISPGDSLMGSMVVNVSISRWFMRMRGRALAIAGMGSLVTSFFSACGPPFFGLLFDYTQSYYLSFSIFIAMLFISAVLSLCLRPPTKERQLSG